VNIIGGPDFTLEEAKIVVSTVGERLSPDAKMIWGAQISEDLEKSLRVMLIVTGVKSAQIVGVSSGFTLDTKKQAEMTSELGIEFLE
jgi:cell division protein FtsZ